MFPVTFQLLLVRPAGSTGGSSKASTVESKMKSPWNPTKLSVGLMDEAETVATKLEVDVSIATLGKLTVVIVEKSAAFDVAIGESPVGLSGTWTKGATTSPKTSAS